MNEARVLYGATEFGAPQFSADLLWRTGFRVHDPMLFLDIGGRGYLFVSSLELGRARKEAIGQTVLEIASFIKRMGARTLFDAAEVFMKRRGIRKIVTPSTLPFGVGRALQKRFSTSLVSGSVYPERAVKSAQEIRQISDAQRVVDHALGRARSVLRASTIRGRNIIYKEKPLTSEFLRKMMESEMYAAGCFASGTIVAGGAQAAHPHEQGSGPLPAHMPIVFDAFPASLKSHYWADCTRTLFKGRPSAGHMKMYETVLVAQKLGMARVNAGADVSATHAAVQKYFEAQGYRTNVSGVSAEGFIHSLGHGVGLELHEAPRVGAAREVLESGNVITIEPGLYYPKAQKGIPIGGIRLEDMVLVTKTGHRNLTQLPKNLRWAVIQ